LDTVHNLIAGSMGLTDTQYLLIPYLFW